MYNRKERRQNEKKMRIHKILKSGSIDLKEIILTKRLEQSANCQTQIKENQENYDREYAEELHAKRIRVYTESLGHSLEEAEAILEKERLADKKRRNRKKKTMNESLPNA